MKKLFLSMLVLITLISPLQHLHANGSRPANPLVTAITDGDQSAVINALHQEADINERVNSEKETPLMVAIHTLAQECKSKGSLFDKIFRTLGLAAFLGGSCLTVRYAVDYIGSRKNTPPAAPQTGLMTIDGQQYKFCPTNPTTKGPSTLPLFVTVTFGNVSYDFRKLEQPAKPAQPASINIPRILESLTLTILGLKFFLEESTTVENQKAIVTILLKDPKLDLSATNAHGKSALVIVRDYIKKSSSSLLTKAMKEIEAQILSVEKSKN